MKRRPTLLASLIVLWFLPSIVGHTASSQVPSGALAILRRIPVQSNGRVKPLETFAKDALRLITGAARWEHQDPVETVLLMMADPETWQARPMISIPFRPLREPLGMDVHTSAISYNDLVASRKLMRMLPAIVQKQQRDEKLTMVEQETLDAFQRFVAISELFEPESRIAMVPPPPGAMTVEWSPIEKSEGYSESPRQAFRSAWADLLTAIRTQNAEAMIANAQRFQQLLREANPSAYPRWRLSLEVAYNRWHPFQLVQVLYLIAFMMLVRALMRPKQNRRETRLGFLAYGAALVLHVTGIMTRVVIGGRP